MSEESGYGKAVGIGIAIGGGSTIGFVAGIATATAGTICLAPAAAFVGIGAGIGAGVGALGKLIFSQIIKRTLKIITFEFKLVVFITDKYLSFFKKINYLNIYIKILK